MGQIRAVCISEKKGTVKKDIGSCRLVEDFGLEGDAHAGSERQVSLLSEEKVEAFRKKLAEYCLAHGGKPADIVPGVFGENLLVSGFDLASLKIGTRFRIGEVLLELMQIGKKCHSGCEISKITGECIMPSEGVFAKVLSGGMVKTGDEIVIAKDTEDKSVITETAEDEIMVAGNAEDTEDEAVIKGNTEKRRGDEKAGTSSGHVSREFRAAILIASDRSYRGEREDLSGPKTKELLEEAGYQVEAVIVLPDDEDGLAEELKRLVDEMTPDVIFTSGGTGFSLRDRMPEATKKVIERETPGISEAIRAHSMKITDKAMLSRAVSGIRGQTLIINLPGSPKAVQECLSFLLPPLAHGIGILRGEADG